MLAPRHLGRSEIDAAVPVPTPASTNAAAPSRLGPAAWAWALFQGVRDPYVILITIYVFAPYFATVVVGDPVRGQATVAMATKYAGWAVMLIAPLAGAIVDRTGRRKPALFAVTALMIPCIAALWFVRPDGSGLGIAGGIALITAITVLFSLSEVFHNALLLPAAGMRAAGQASGLALAFGNFVSVFMLSFVLWAFALPGKTPWGFIPARPLFGLDTALHEQDRVTALIVAAAMAVGSIPLFRIVPDVAATGLRLGAAVRAGVRDLRDIVRDARGHSNTLFYILTRMIFTDGLTGVLVFSGVYASGRMGWQALELLAYGILLSIFAVGGGLLAARFEAAVGPRRALQLELFVVILAQVAGLGMGRDEVLFQPWDAASHAPLWAGPMFRTIPEFGLLLIGFVSAVSVSSAYATSRTLLTRVAPPSRIGIFFGLYSLAGAATMWLGPLLVEIATRASGSQPIGLLPIVGLLATGLTMLFFVRGGERLRD